MSRGTYTNLNIQRGEEVQEQPSNFVKYLTIFGSVAAVSFVAVTSIGSASYTSSATTSTTMNSVNIKSVDLKRGVVPTYATMGETEMTRAFELFQEMYGRKYESETERVTRFGYFKDFLATIDQRNAEESGRSTGAVHGITRFADMTPAEFKQSFLGYRASTKRSKTITSVPKFKGSTTAVDWAGTYTTAVKDQGYCGSCWAFSATEQIESDAIRAGLISTSEALSPQQIVSCDHYDLGCDGGNTETAYTYVMSTTGLESDKDYPYTSYWDITGTCKVTGTVTPEVALAGWTNIEPDEDQMIDFVLSTGPLSVCLDASKWATYTSGIVSASACGSDVDHCVQVTGVNTDDGYWIVRNSWGTSWGLEGYIYLELGTDTCAITTDPSYTFPKAAYQH